MLAMNPLLMLRLPMRRGSSFSESGLPAFACAAGDGDACAFLSLCLSFLFLSSDPLFAVLCGACVCVCGTATAVSEPAQRLKMSKRAANVRENLLCIACASEKLFNACGRREGGRASPRNDGRPVETLSPSDSDARAARRRESAGVPSGEARLRSAREYPARRDPLMRPVAPRVVQAFRRNRRFCWSFDRQKRQRRPCGGSHPDPFGGDRPIIQSKGDHGVKTYSSSRRKNLFVATPPRRVLDSKCPPCLNRQWAAEAILPAAKRMRRIQDKIKDLVEPQSFEQVGNFAEDPAQALAAYRFTDVTSDLLSRWLDALANLQPGRGAAHALAGARGVGKSHTLAVFGALAGSERLCQSLEDAHVSASAERLAGRRCAVVRVERGTRPTLSEELAVAFARFFGGSEEQWTRTPAEALAVAASRATGETLVVVVDTSFNRPARVARDDGPALGELAEAAHDLNVFLALALDDDIADADGANVAVACTYRIEYLDPENLYRVADQFVLRKKPQVGDTLREIYQSLRATVHEFNWSQSRFAALYPVHPLVAEVASGVRLYVPTFAFLPFAASAAARATSRPALSLVLLDEVFDAAEDKLREAEELRRAFIAYDHLTERSSNQLPTMQRSQSRRPLNRLFVLSLDGRDVTPGEMCAALLLTDDEAGEDAPRRVAEVLSRFAAESAPGSLVLADGPGGETRYRFHISAQDAAHAQVAAPSHTEPHDSKQHADESHTEKDERNAATVNESDAASVDERNAVGVDDNNGVSVVGNDAASVDESDAASVDESDAVVNVVSSSDSTTLINAVSNTPVNAVGNTVVGNDAGHTVVNDVGGVSAKPAAGEVAQTNADESADAETCEEAAPLSEESVEWARLLTGRRVLVSSGARGAREELHAALGAWLKAWRARGLGGEFGARAGGSPA